jgi:hypothetical protein
LTDENPADPPAPQPAPAPAPTSDLPPARDLGSPPPPTSEEAIRQLRDQAAGLSAVRFSEIISEGTIRLADIQTVNIFQGDVAVDGDFLTGSGSGGRRASAKRPSKVRLSQEELTEATEYFVAPDGFEQDVDQLAERNLLVIAGPAHTGRRTRALATVREVLRRAGRGTDVFALSSSILRNIGWRVPQADCGLLILDEPGSDGKWVAERIDDRWLDAVARKLAESGCFLVVVTGPPHGALKTSLRYTEFVVDDLALPSSMEIVLRRVNSALPWAPADLEQRLTAAKLEETLEGRDDPGFAVRAAGPVIEALRENPDVDLTEVVDRLADPEGQVREWLGQDPDLARVAFVLATAVLEGASYLKVADAAVALYRRLSSNSSTLVPRYLKNLLAEHDWIERVSADEDPQGTLALRFRYARLRPVVLAVTWFELDGARDKITEWIQELAGHSDVEVRARAAHAAGILASKDFEHGVHRYLQPWANSTSELLRQSAAQGLNVAGTLGPNEELAWHYVEQWAALGGSSTTRKLPATAGFAVGGPLGERNPHRALRVLNELVRADGWGLVEPAAVSVQTLLEAGRTREVLAALAEWTAAKADDDSVTKALMTFVYAVHWAGATDERPVLLVDARDYRDQLPELWGRALANEQVREFAVEALRSWVRLVDHDRTTYESVLDVLVDIGDRSSTDYSRVMHVLAKWSQDPDDPSEAATDFYNVFVELEAEAS